MIKLVTFLRDVFIMILALLTSFGLGIIYSSKMMEKALEEVNAKRRRTYRTSYRDLWKEEES